MACLQDSPIHTADLFELAGAVVADVAGGWGKHFDECSLRLGSEAVIVYYPASFID